jgi:NADPH:quinone reductase-like Zn-dependent oxidoreductase
MAGTMRAFGLKDESSEAAFLEVPVPEPGPREVRVNVQASSVNGFDAFVASGMARGMMGHRYPVIVGKDFAGVVDQVGDGAAFAVGDEVAGIMPPSQDVGEGSYAGYLVSPSEGYIVAKPASLDAERAASVGLAALAAQVSLDHVAPSEGSTVLIVGATGGVGTYAVQLASARGATVIATALPEDEEWIRALGADETADYTGDVPAAVRSSHPDGIDALIVAVHVGDGLGTLADLVRDGGAVASTVGGTDALADRDIRATDVYGQSDPAAYATVMRLAGDGALTVPLTKSYAFDELPEALGLVGKRSSRGKIAIHIG